MPAIAPSRITAMRIAHSHNFGEFRRNHHNRKAALGEIAHDAMAFRLRADVDTLRRLVEDQHFRLGGQPAADGDFLLIAAGERRSRSIDAVRLDAQPLTQVSAIVRSSAT